MAEQQIEFVYRNIELYKSESLGSGSYGGVCKAKCDGLLCAAKIMHPTLFDLRDPGTVSYLRKFQEECRLLSLARHPNVVQYLATYSDPETRLPVLLMELCDESLTGFLERSPGPLPYHTQLNISHDIALALVYLHSNGLIHRDLTGNNVLMIAGTRAKITDFGMSKLASVNPRMRALTLCPGNVLYMSPEALDESKSYTDKLDIFSFGVLVIQILTRQFPNPTDRFQPTNDVRYPTEVRLVVSEIQRRRIHLKSIVDTHCLKPVAIACLKDENDERPSAQQLSERLSQLKLASQYRESKQQAAADGDEVPERLRRQIRELQQQNMQKEQQNTEKQRQIEQLSMQIENLQQQLLTQRISADDNQSQAMQLQNTVEKSKEQLQRTIEASDRNQNSEAAKNGEQQQKQQNDKTTSKLQHTRPANERKIQQSQQQDTANSDQPQQIPVKTDTPQAATASAGQRDPTKRRKRWRMGIDAPLVMYRGAAAVHENTAYFRPANSRKVYSYRIVAGVEQWSVLPDNPNTMFSLAAIDGLITSVGGKKGSSQTNVLLSLTGEGKNKQWSEVYPPMPTTRTETAAVSTEQVVIVAGGTCCQSCKTLDTLEVMNISTKEWSTSRLPQPVSSLSGVVCGDQLYLAGSSGRDTNKLMLTCSLADLVSQSLGDGVQKTDSQDDKIEVWTEIHSLPVIHSTLTTLDGDLLAVGGRDNTDKLTTDVYKYDPFTDSWRAIRRMKNGRARCFAVVLPKDGLVVVGGHEEGFLTKSSVAIME